MEENVGEYRHLLYNHDEIYVLEEIKMKKIYALILVITIGLILSGCVNTPDHNSPCNDYTEITRQTIYFDNGEYTNTPTIYAEVKNTSDKSLKIDNCYFVKLNKRNKPKFYDYIIESGDTLKPGEYLYLEKTLFDYDNELPNYRIDVYAKPYEIDEVEQKIMTKTVCSVDGDTLNIDIEFINTGRDIYVWSMDYVIFDSNNNVYYIRNDYADDKYADIFLESESTCNSIQKISKRMDIDPNLQYEAQIINMFTNNESLEKKCEESEKQYEKDIISSFAYKKNAKVGELGTIYRADTQYTNDEGMFLVMNFHSVRKYKSYKVNNGATVENVVVIRNGVDYSQNRDFVAKTAWFAAYDAEGNDLKVGDIFTQGNGDYAEIIFEIDNFDSCEYIIVGGLDKSKLAFPVS